MQQWQKAIDIVKDEIKYEVGKIKRLKVRKLKFLTPLLEIFMMALGFIFLAVRGRSTMWSILDFSSSEISSKCTGDGWPLIFALVETMGLRKALIIARQRGSFVTRTASELSSAIRFSATLLGRY